MSEQQIATVIRQKIEEFAGRQDRTCTFIAAARDGAIAPRQVGLYLSSLTYNVSHTPTHLEMARTLASELEFEPLAAYFSEKLAEEEGHELWGTADLALLQRKLGTPASGSPAATAVELMGFVESSIRRDPRLYISYILFTEYITVLLGRSLTDALVRRCGIPRGALTIVDKHVEADVAHVKDGFMAARTLLDDPNLREPALETLETTMRLFSNFTKEVAAA